MTTVAAVHPKILAVRTSLIRQFSFINMSMLNCVQPEEDLIELSQRYWQVRNL